jgi:flavin reductase (DIM6/NTAB) family NADH-FMN oxidoreductase RutF
MTVSLIAEQFASPMTANPIDPGTFRMLMRNVPAQVNIIASGKPGHRFGLTATAVCSLTDTPPTVLVCINRRVGAHDAIIENGLFSINALAAGQDDVAVMFSGQPGVKGESRFSAGRWSEGRTGVPILAGAVCTLECRLADIKPASTHTIVFGEIVAGTAHDEVTPLVYLRGNYLALGPTDVDRRKADKT